MTIWGSLLALTALLMSALASSAAAEESCGKDWPDGSGMGAWLATQCANDRVEAKVDAATTALMATVGQTEWLMDDPAIRSGLAGQAAAWRKYISAECNLVGDLSQAGDPWRHARAAVCEGNLMRTRLRRLVDARRCLLRPTRRDSPATCLYQLVPLAVPIDR